MNRKHTESEKSIIITRYNNGESVADLVRDTQIPRSTIYVWIKEAADRDSNKNKNYFIFVILDLFSRMVVGYRVGKTNSTQLVRGTYPVQQFCDGILFFQH